MVLCNSAENSASASTRRELRCKGRQCSLWAGWAAEPSGKTLLLEEGSPQREVTQQFAQDQNTAALAALSWPQSWAPGSAVQLGQSPRCWQLGSRSPGPCPLPLEPRVRRRPGQWGRLASCFEFLQVLEKQRILFTAASAFDTDHSEAACGVFVCGLTDGHTVAGQALRKSAGLQHQSPSAIREYMIPVLCWLFSLVFLIFN